MPFGRVFSPVFTIFALSVVVFPASARGSIGERFGLTSGAASIAGARAGAGEMTSASAYENPAQLSLLPADDAPAASRIRFHWSLLYADSAFEKIRGVVVENPVISDTTRVADVNTDYPATLGQSVGFSIQSRRSPHRWGLGAVAYLPVDQLALVDSGEAFVPEYSLHRGRTQKPEFQFALSGLLTPRLSFGAGVYLGARLESDTTIFLNQGAGTVSTMRISAKLKTRATPHFGLSYLASDAVSLGAVFRLASSMPQSLNVQAGARAIGNVSALDFSFPALGTMYYQPASLQLGAQLRYAAASSIFLQVDFQAWSDFKSPTLVILDPETSTCDPSCGVDFSEGRGATAATRNILVPSVGHAWRLGSGELRAGFLHRPSIYRGAHEGAGNAVDPAESRLTFGYGWEFAEFLVFDAPGRLDLHAAYSRYARRDVRKSAGDENGNLANRKVGDPGYAIGGYAWGGGLTVSLYL